MHPHTYNPHRVIRRGWEQCKLRPCTLHGAIILVSCFVLRLSVNFDLFASPQLLAAVIHPFLGLATKYFNVRIPRG